MRRDRFFLCSLFALWSILSIVFLLIPRTHPIYRQASDPRIKSVLERISDPKPIDVAFLGSSKTMTGIDSDLLSESLNLEVLNLGCNWYGPNLWLSFYKTLLETHQPKVVFVELSFLRRYHGHVNFKRVAPMNDILSFSISHESFSNWIYSVPRITLQSFRYFLFDASLSSTSLPHRGQHILPELSEDKKLALIKSFEPELKKGPFTISQIEGAHLYKKKLSDWLMEPQIHDYRDLASASKQTEVILLAFPKQRVSVMSPDLKKKWQSIATLILLPPALLDQSSYWSDLTHLNSEGARFLSKKIEERLSEHFKGQVKKL